MDGWMDGDWRMDGWINRWMDGWMDDNCMVGWMGVIPPRKGGGGAPGNQPSPMQHFQSRSAKHVLTLSLCENFFFFPFWICFDMLPFCRTSDVGRTNIVSGRHVGAFAFGCCRDAAPTEFGGLFLICFDFFFKGVRRGGGERVRQPTPSGPRRGRAAWNNLVKTLREGLLNNCK